MRSSTTRVETLAALDRFNAGGRTSGAEPSYDDKRRASFVARRRGVWRRGTYTVPRCRGSLVGQAVDHEGRAALGDAAVAERQRPDQLGRLRQLDDRRALAVAERVLDLRDVGVTVGEFEDDVVDVDRRVALHAESQRAPGLATDMAFHVLVRRARRDPRLADLDPVLLRRRRPAAIDAPADADATGDAGARRRISARHRRRRLVVLLGR